MLELSVKELLEAGVHFGHQKRRWNPKMTPFIYMERQGIHIIDIRQTLMKLNEAYEFARDMAAQNKKFIFIGTKRQASDVIKSEAEKAETFYVNERWIGGTFTNFFTIRKSVEKLFKIESLLKGDTKTPFTKKEIAKLQREKMKMDKYYSGIREMDRVPDVMYVVDVKKELNAIKEANLAGVKIIGVVDTNGDPDTVDYPIPANDDAMRSINLITSIISSAIVEGKKKYEDEKEKEKEEEKEEK